MIKPRSSQSLLVVAAAAFLLPTLVSAAPAKKGLVVNSAAEVKWMPTDPSNPGAPQMAVLSGDPMKGPSSLLLKIQPGTAPMHSHTSAYSATVIQGPVKHWDGKDTEAAASSLPPGSHWSQPAKQVHGDACLAPKGSDCVLYIEMAGKFDMTPAVATAAK